MSPEYPFDEAATARAVIDDSGVLVEWNAGAERLLGHRAADVLGHPAVHLLADEEYDRPGAPQGERWDGILSLRHRDGGTVSVWLLAHRVRPRDDGPYRWLVVTPIEGDGPRVPGDPLDNVALLDSPCAIAIYDERLRLRRINAVMAEVLSLAEENIRGLRAPELSGMAQSHDIERQLLRVLTTGRGTDVRTYVPVGGDRTYA
ncbi:PAS domain-containing protein, partial [Streptomyces sp. HD]|uniref:PAS domain-containing protein n=1 Tax=Streptomyces sp. HD TaxID=3020892 RepID=UPI00232E5A81